jgi:hypothetical protein
MKLHYLKPTLRLLSHLCSSIFLSCYCLCFALNVSRLIRDISDVLPYNEILASGWIRIPDTYELKCKLPAF